jgi:hypothetical protein
VRYIILLTISSILFLAAPVTVLASYIEDDSGQSQNQPSSPPPSQSPGPISPVVGGPPGAIEPQAGGPPEQTGATGNTTGTTGTTGTSTGTTGSGYGEDAGDTGALPRTGDDDFEMVGIRTACGEVREINYGYYILSVGSRLRTRHYVVTPTTTFTQLEMIEEGDYVMISYVIIHKMRIAVRITVHE